ncbi:MAG: fibronectin [Candidatus Neomarinimicrobiota bacterium]
MRLTKWSKASHLLTMLGISIVLLTTESWLQAQTGPAVGLRRYIRVGRLHHYLDAYGRERATTGTYYEGMIWPAEYNRQDCFVIRRHFLAAKSWTSPEGVFYPYYALQFYQNGYTRTAAMECKATARFPLPAVYVDGFSVNAPYEGDIDEIDPTIKPDRIITNVVRTDMGVTMTRRMIGFSQQYHDDYFIVEFTYKNDGNTDDDDEIELPGQTITAFRSGGCMHMTTCREASYLLHGRDGWGADQWQTKRGETYPDWVAGDPTADSLRCTMTWLGQLDLLNFDNIGGPDIEGNGRLSSAQHAGICILHADKSASDKSDDPHHPSTLGWNGNDNVPQPTSISGPIMKVAYDFAAGVMTYGDTTRMWEENRDKYPQSLVDYGGASAAFGYGPYDIPFGDSIRYVEVWAVNGLDRQKCELIGANWKNGGGPFLMPDGSETSFTGLSAEANDYKNAWVYTGMDSLLLTYGRARRAFLLDYDIPQPPRPPQVFNVASGGDRILLTWEPAEGVEEASNFGGYRIYRGVGRWDTTYTEIFACGVGTANPEIVYEFNDLTPIRGFDYYYYITSFSDGSLNHSTANPGGQLESSRFYTQTSRPANLKRPAGEALEDIRIVPNPWHIRQRGLAQSDIFFPGLTAVDRLMFYNIPGWCTIRIYTERGDLVTTIEHDDGTGDEAWNSITDSRQVVVSGVYIAYIEVTKDQHDPVTDEILYRKGDSIIRKFTVIR